ncbi:MAG: lysophospholipid acyltransferase family protein [Acidobacteriota bacterium]
MAPENPETPRTPASSGRPSPAPAPHFRPSILFTLLGNATLVVATLVVGLIATVVGWIPPRGTWMFMSARVWSRLLLVSGGIRLCSRFEQPLEKRRGYVFMANHQSMIDIPALIAEVPGEVRFLAKKGLFKVPIFGWALKAGGFIPVDRGNKQAAAQIYQTAKKTLDSGRSILLFPEQTRSRSGELLPFKRGGAVIALETGHAIVPVGLVGTRSARPVGSFRINPGTVEVRYGTPIEVEGRSREDWPELLDEVRREIERLI